MTRAPDLLRDACRPGHYCPTATVWPLACPAGTINALTGQDAARDCVTTPAGYYTVEGAANYTGLCAPGHYCPAGSSGPTQVSHAMSRKELGSSPPKSNCQMPDAERVPYNTVQYSTVQYIALHYICTTLHLMLHFTCLHFHHLTFTFTFLTLHYALMSDAGRVPAPLLPRALRRHRHRLVRALRLGRLLPLRRDAARHVPARLLLHHRHRRARAVPARHVRQQHGRAAA